MGQPWISQVWLSLVLRSSHCDIHTSLIPELDAAYPELSAMRFRELVVAVLAVGSDIAVAVPAPDVASLPVGDRPKLLKRDADFFEVRTKMTKDMSGRKGDPSDKYFRESAPSIASPRLIYQF